MTRDSLRKTGDANITAKLTLLLEELGGRWICVGGEAGVAPCCCGKSHAHIMATKAQASTIPWRGEWACGQTLIEAAERLGLDPWEGTAY